MRFVELNAEVGNLRRSLRTFVGERALQEITIQDPVSDDEASFLRLVAWSYVLVFEAGRIAIPFLIKLPSSLDSPKSKLESTCDLVHDLRTWSFHNLSFTRERELKISRRTTLWFIEKSGSSPPSSIEGWGTCFASLCADVCSIVRHCKGALESVLSTPEDKATTIDDLKRRVDRNWPAYKFDEVLTDAVTRIGQTLNVPNFRQNRLAKWRAYLEAIPENDDPHALIVRFIERDVLDHFEAVLPIDGNDIMAALNLHPGPAVGHAFEIARRLYSSGVTDREQLLACLEREVGDSSNVK